MLWKKACQLFYAFKPKLEKLLWIALPAKFHLVYILRNSTDVFLYKLKYNAMIELAWKLQIRDSAPLLLVALFRLYLRDDTREDPCIVAKYGVVSRRSGHFSSSYSNSASNRLPANREWHEKEENQPDKWPWLQLQPPFQATVCNLLAARSSSQRKSVHDVSNGTRQASTVNTGWRGQEPQTI